MKLLEIALCFYLVVYATGEQDAESDPNPSSTEKELTTDHRTTITSTGPTSTEDEFSTRTTLEKETPTDIDTSNDTIIEFSSTTDVGISLGGNDSSSTVEGDETTLNSSTTYVDDEVTTETNRSACLEYPCKNGGTCKDNTTLTAAFSCDCPEGFAGVRCEITDKCIINEDGQLCKNGACLYSGDGLIRYCYCFLGDYWDIEKSKCRAISSACDPNPCANGGTCTLHSGGEYDCNCMTGFSGDTCEIENLCDADEDCGPGVCTLSEDKKSRFCKCNEGFYLKENHHTCKDITSPCDLEPCQNGGECSSSDDNEYNCTCTKGFSGDACEIKDWCVTDGDCGDGICMLSDGNKTRSCQCNDGFYLVEHSHTCEKITNICQPNPCLHDGVCAETSVGDFNCTCSEGYTGKKCDVRDMCIMDGGDAFCTGGECVNNYELSMYYCTCSDGQYFKYAERMCADVNLCPLLRCESTEICKEGYCKCKDNYKRNNDSGKCEPDFCSSSPCPVADMMCEEGTGEMDFKCSCREGFAFNGTHCNEALCIFPQLNSCNQLCAVTEDGYDCSCDDDFTLKEDNHTCELKGNNTCLNKTCDNGSCAVKSDEEVCICPPGYKEVDGNCVDVCSASLLVPGICPTNECDSLDNGFRCRCEGKFALSEDKTTCIGRNVCQENEIGWKNCNDKNANCVRKWNSTDGFECRCSAGQVETEDGTCHDVCSIEKNQRNCTFKGATCDSDSKGNFVCRCPPYFQLDEKAGKCNKPADVSYLINLPLDLSTYGLENRKKRSLDMSVDYQKVTRDVQLTIQEMFVGFKGVNILHCNTTQEYILCKLELQFAMEQERQLLRLQMEDICLTGGDKKKCLLPPSLVMAKERIKQDVVIGPTDPCDEYIKEEICGSETTCKSSPRHQSFNCSCKPGFAMRKKSYPFGNAKSSVESCRDIDECLDDDPCPSNSDCFNTIGSYTCSCKSGYRNIKESSGAGDIECVGLCDPNPCTHGLCSRRGDHAFDCKCDAGYRGALCDLQDENFKQAKVNTVIVGVVLGGVLLITFILFAVCVSRLKKRKVLENPGPNYYNSTEMVTSI